MRIAVLVTVLATGCLADEYNGGFADFEDVSIRANDQLLRIEATPEGDGVDYKPPCPILADARATVGGVEVPVLERGGETSPNTVGCRTAKFELTDVPALPNATLELVDGDGTIAIPLRDYLLPIVVRRLDGRTTWEYRAGETVETQFGDPVALPLASVKIREADRTIAVDLATRSTFVLPAYLAPGAYELVYTAPSHTDKVRSHFTVINLTTTIQPITIVP